MDPERRQYRMYRGMPMRMAGWLLAIAVLLALVAWKSPQQIPVMIYKLCVVCIAAYVAHRLDKTFFSDKEGECDEIARAIVFVGVMLGMTLGV